MVIFSYLYCSEHSFIVHFALYRTSHHYTEHSEYNLTLYEDGMCTLVRNKKGNNAFLRELILYKLCLLSVRSQIVLVTALLF